MDRELACISRYADDQTITWDDVCYTWEEQSRISQGRSRAIKTALDNVEQQRQTDQRNIRRRAKSPQYNTYINVDEPETYALDDFIDRSFQSPPPPSRQSKSMDSYQQWESKSIARQFSQSYKEFEKSGTNDSYENWLKDTYREEQLPGGGQPSGDSLLGSLFQRLDFGVVYESQSKPRFYLETVLPIYMDDDEKEVLFTHDRISQQANTRITSSAGLGYRRLVLDESLLAGINGFFDFQSKFDHYRAGAGIELITADWEARMNYYNGLSPTRLVEQNLVTNVFEKAADGFDVELGGAIPAFPKAKLFGGYYDYEFDQSEGPSGWKTRAEYKATKFLVFDLEYLSNSQGEDTVRLDGRFTVSFDTFRPKDIVAALRDVDPSVDEQVDLKKKLLNRVERDFKIVTERWDEVNPLLVGSGGDIQIQLIWSTDSDMDLHINLPAGVPSHVYYVQKQSFIGADLFAELDVDDIPLSGLHADHPTRDHVENIFVSEGQVVPGTYSAFVDAFNLVTPTPVTVLVFIEGQFVRVESHTFTSTGEDFNLVNIVIP